MKPTLSYQNLADNKAVVNCICGWKTEPFHRGPFDPAEALAAYNLDHLECSGKPPKTYYAVARLRGTIDGEEMMVLTELSEDIQKMTDSAKASAQKGSVLLVVEIKVVSSWTG